MRQHFGKRRLAFLECLRRATVQTLLLLLTLSPVQASQVLLHHSHDGLDEHSHELPAELPEQAQPVLHDWHHAEHAADLLQHDDHEASVPHGRLIRTCDPVPLQQPARVTTDLALRLEVCSMPQRERQQWPIQPLLDRHGDAPSLQGHGQSVLVGVLRSSRAILI